MNSVIHNCQSEGYSRALFLNVLLLFIVLWKINEHYIFFLNMVIYLFSEKVNTLFCGYFENYKKTCIVNCEVYSKIGFPFGYVLPV